MIQKFGLDSFHFIVRRIFQIFNLLIVKDRRVAIEYVGQVTGHNRCPSRQIRNEIGQLVVAQRLHVIVHQRSDDRLTPVQKDAQVAKLITYYKSRPDLAFSSVPKSMELMEGQYYSTTFRTKYPKFNGLIWAYHWLQVGLYEPLLTGKTPADRQTGIVAAVTRPDGQPDPAVYFWATGVLSTFLDNAPTYLVFFNTAGGDAKILMTTMAPTLAAISAGAVFMGANSYIGNAPNMMVKAIAEDRGVTMPSFFGYMAWSTGILLPLFVVMTFIWFK